MSFSTAGSRPLRVSLLSMYPPSVVLGGQEIQYLQTRRALQHLGVSVESVNYCNPDDQFDLLHLFGLSPNYYDLCFHAAGRYPTVLSCVSGARYAWRWRAWLWRGVSRCVRLARLQTTYDRLAGVGRYVSAAICLNQLEAQFVDVTYGLPFSRIVIIPNGVDDQYFCASGDLFAQTYGIRDFVLFTGNIVKRKNPLMLAHALRELGYPGVFIGGTLTAEQPYAKAFEDLVESTPNLTWIRRLDNEDPLLASAYAAARVFCLPSSSEAQSLSALEAMAAGRPVILGDVPYAYQTPFESSLKCDLKNEMSLVSCLQRAMTQPETSMSRLSDRYRWPNVAQEVLKVYQRVLAERE
jgi:glycosyltransferase involved in cell wall biosynthesis